MSSFTEPAFMLRCSGDWGQVVASEKHGLVGRIYFGTLVNLDEAYRFLKMVGLVPNASASKGQDTGCQSAPDAASEVNKLFQTGSSTLTLKSSPGHGQGDTPTISLGLAGNAHPSVVIPMLRGKYGADDVKISVRLLFSTGRPIEPHEGLPLALQLPQGFKKWLWPKLLPSIAQALGLPRGIDQLPMAQATLEKARRGAGPNDSDDEDRWGL